MISDVFPEPVLPIIATFSPRFMTRFKPLNSGEAPSESLKVIFDSSISFHVEIFRLSFSSAEAIRGADKKPFKLQYAP